MGTGHGRVRGLEGGLVAPDLGRVEFARDKAAFDQERVVCAVRVVSDRE